MSNVENSLPPPPLSACSLDSAHKIIKTAPKFGFPAPIRKISSSISSKFPHYFPWDVHRPIPRKPTTTKTKDFKSVGSSYEDSNNGIRAARPNLFYTELKQNDRNDDDDNDDEQHHHHHHHHRPSNTTHKFNYKSSSMPPRDVCPEQKTVGEKFQSENNNIKESSSAVFVLPPKSTTGTGTGSVASRVSPDKESPKNPYHNSRFNENESSQYHLSNYHSKDVDWTTQCFNNPQNCLINNRKSIIKHYPGEKTTQHSNYPTESLSRVGKDKTERVISPERSERKEHHTGLHDSTIIRRVFKESIEDLKPGKAGPSYSFSSPNYRCIVSKQRHNSPVATSKPKVVREVDEVYDQDNHVYKQRLSGGRNRSLNQSYNELESCHTYNEVKFNQSKGQSSTRTLDLDEDTTAATAAHEKELGWRAPTSDYYKYEPRSDEKATCSSFNGARTKLKESSPPVTASNKRSPSASEESSRKLARQRSKSSDTGTGNKGSYKSFYFLNGEEDNSYKRSKHNLKESNESLSNSRSIKHSKRKSMQHSLTDSLSHGSLYLSSVNSKCTFPIRKTPTRTANSMHSRFQSASKDSSASGESFENECSVRVAVRIRPQNAREIIDLCRICTSVIPGEPQIVLGTDKAFTFDYLYNINAKQSDVYQGCVQELVESALCGYNATVLAYGQTGSGKTYTMGTGFDSEPNDTQQGIIPRTVFHIFSKINEFMEENDDNIRFNLSVRFIELYNEDIIDLLDPHSKGKLCRIQENDLGHITVTGATILTVSSPLEALRYLQEGAVARTTASTQMNHQSSRSHALFTILIERQTSIPMMNDGSDGFSDLETLTSKLHFVDLAGSERLKRTGATGERAREGISINCGLLALGNCISALGDQTRNKRVTHIPYRDSKLTRLLQDSLGGNSRTLMIACVSPSDRDFMETLNTLKYANRARNIKNKVQINQDQSSRTIAALRKEIAALQLELLEFKQGKRVVDGEGRHAISDTFYENEMLSLDNKRLQQRLKSLNETIKMLTERNTQLQVEKEMHRWSSLVDSNLSVKDMISGYVFEIERLQGKLLDLKRENSAKDCQGRVPTSSLSRSIPNTKELIERAKSSLIKQREREAALKNNIDNYAKDNSSELSEESDNDWETQSTNIQEDIDDVNCDIEIKSKLIKQLELSQHCMNQMRQQYEDKMMLLNSKVANTQKERDEILSMIGPNMDNQTSDKMKQIKEEYERKITNMQKEIKKLHQAQKEHDRQRQELMAQETKLRNLRTQLDDLKKHKASLMKKLSEQSNKYKKEDSKKLREIAQLRKEQRKQENTVRSLQAKVLAKDEILKRKNEEVSNLRRSQRSLRRRGVTAGGALVSPTATADPGVLDKSGSSGSFDAGAARKRWCDIWRAIGRAANKRQMAYQFENELDRLINERANLTHYLQERLNRSGNSDFDNEEDLVRSNLAYVQQNIDDAQQMLMELEDENNKMSADAGREERPTDAQTLISNIQGVEEAKYILDHLSRHSIEVTCKMANVENRLAEHITRLQEAQEECHVQQQLLQHFIKQNGSEKTTSDLFESLCLNLGDEMVPPVHLNDSQHSFKSNETYNICSDNNGGFPIGERCLENDLSSEHFTDLNAKIRSRMAQVSKMLFGEKEDAEEKDIDTINSKTNEQKYAK